MLNRRKYISFLLCLWTVFQLYFVTFGIISAITFRAIHLALLLIFTFLLYPSKNYYLDCVFVSLTIIVFGYLIGNYNRVAITGGRLNQADIYPALIGLALVLEAGRRISVNLTILAILFLVYSWLGKYIPGTLSHNGFTLKRVLSVMFWGTQGILGTGISVSTTYIFVFILFGAFLKHSGFSNFVNEIASVLTGKSVGGPAKVSVISSAILGMVNGSAVANVATTGTITIPIMKSYGYSKEFAGAVEAAASTGGQFCPPVMGAVGFVMAEFLGISYSDVMIAAAIPAFLYYLGILLTVHIEARNLGLVGFQEEKTDLSVLRQWPVVIPIIVLIISMMLGYSVIYSGVIGIIATILVGLIGKDPSEIWRDTIASAEEGARGAIKVGVCCGIIGILIGVTTLTSLGLNLGYLILDTLGNSNIYLVGLAVAAISIILGMGIPGLAAYVIVQSVATSILIKVGVLPIAAHLFCLIYACLSNITPPVAISSYVAAGISGGNTFKTGLLSVKIGLIGFIIPMFFLNNPIMLGIGNFTIWQYIGSVIIFSAGTCCIVMGVSDYFKKVRYRLVLDCLAILCGTYLMEGF